MATRKRKTPPRADSSTRAAITAVGRRSRSDPAHLIPPTVAVRTRRRAAVASSADDDAAAGFLDIDLPLRNQRLARVQGRGTCRGTLAVYPDARAPRHAVPIQEASMVRCKTRRVCGAIPGVDGHRGTGRPRPGRRSQDRPPAGGRPSRDACSLPAMTRSGGIEVHVRTAARRSTRPPSPRRTVPPARRPGRTRRVPDRVRARQSAWRATRGRPGPRGRGRAGGRHARLSFSDDVSVTADAWTLPPTCPTASRAGRPSSSSSRKPVNPEDRLSTSPA